MFTAMGGRGFLAFLLIAASGCALRHAREAEDERLPPHATWFVRQRMAEGHPVEALRTVRAGNPVAPGVWVQGGPFNVGGRLTALAVDPNDPDHVWAGAAAGGVFESTDAGDTWTPVFDDQPVLNIGALAAHPTSSDIVYVGTGETNGAGYSYEGDGIYRTIDGGDTWQHLGLVATRRIGRIAIDPANPQRVFVAAMGSVYVPDDNRGVYRSTDGGSTWTRVLFVAPTAGAIDLVIDPSNPSRVYAAIWESYSTPTDWHAGGVNSGIWRSLDGGTTWARLAGGLPAPGAAIGRIGLALAASSPQTLYALYVNDPGAFLDVYKTTNGGASWSKLNSTGASRIFGGYGYYLGQIRVDPGNPDVVYLMDVEWARSTDGGRSYDTLPVTYVDHHDLVILPDRIYNANDGGFFRSTDGGTIWAKSFTLPVTQFYDLGINPLDTTKRYGGSQDMGSVRTTDGGTSNWFNFNGGDGFHCEIDPVDPQRVYMEASYGKIRRSLDGGATSEFAYQGISQQDRRNWSTPIVHDPVVGQRLYAGTFRVYRSTNGASTWSAISGDLTDGPPAHLVAEEEHDHLASVAEGTITTIAPSALSTQVVWAGTDDGNVWVTQNGGSSWAHVDVPGRSEWVTRLEADPFSVSSAYVTFSGHRNGSRLPRLFRTVDFGATWTDISGDLPDVPLNCVNADPDPAMRGRLFVCTDLGVYVTDDYGASWSVLGTGMPPVVVHDLDLVDGTRQLFAGTHGRSMLVYDLDQLGPADADGDGSDNLSDCRPDDASVFAAPGEVAGLAIGTDKITLSWSPAGEHQVLRGLVAELPVGGASDACLAASTSAASIVDASVPPEGAAYWYLVRARNVCGTGSYGTSSSGAPRAGTACP